MLADASQLEHVDPEEEKYVGNVCQLRESVKIKLTRKLGIVIV